MVSEVLQIQTKKTYSAAPAVVFAALTTAESLTKWFSPTAEIKTEVEELDVRVGGKYRIRFHLPDGEIHVVSGEFQEIQSPRKLVYTWSWEGDDPHAGVKTLVSICIEEHQGGAELELRHERLPSNESMERHAAGWEGCLERLESFVG